MPAATDAANAGRPARQRILEAAHELFYRDGIRATGVDRVIAAAGVTKVTFYRHFPGKSDLVLAFLEHRHAQWMAWFTGALARHRARGHAGCDAIAPALAEWLRRKDYRGCAFINTASEIGAGDARAMEVSRRHKREMRQAIAGLLPRSRASARLASAAAQAVDGAIVRAQIDGAPAAALATLRWSLQRLAAAESAGRVAGRRARPAQPSG
jgi:AcrR family transcriptional regulator